MSKSPQQALKPLALSPGARSPELFRQLYVSLDLPLDPELVVIGITSAIGGEGRTTVALGLAQTLVADLGLPVTLVEADLERPSFALHFDIAASPGLCEVLRSEVTLTEVMRPVSDRLSIVTTGAPGTDSARLLTQLPLTDPFRKTPRLRGFVVVDLPPIINSSYSVYAAGATDAVVLVVRAGVTPAGVVREAISRLGDHAPRGVVLNGQRSALPGWWPGSRA